MRTIPSVENVKDVDIKKILAAIKEAIEILAGQRGDIEDRALLVKDLVDIGLIRVHNGETLYNPNKEGEEEFATVTVQRSIVIGGLSGTFEAIDPATGTTKTFTIVGGTITGMA